MSQATVSSAAWAPIAEVDPELWAAMEAERHRQPDKIELIASENYVYAAVEEAQGSWLTNKYAEGLPGKRYYGGCEYVDVAEQLARDRALALFPGAEHVNVQPHSGAQANMAAYFAVLRARRPDPGHEPGPRRPPDPRLAGQLLRQAVRGPRVRRRPRDRADRLRRPRGARPSEVRPKVIVAGASAYPRTWDFERMAAIAHAVGALLFVDMAHFAGLVAAGLHPSPFPHADLVTTTTHKTLRGPRGGLVFARADLPEGVDRADFPALGKSTLAAAIDKSVFPGVQGGPLMHVIAAKAVALQLAATEELPRATRPARSRTRAVLAETVAAAGARLVTGGTDNHLVLVDVTPLGVTGREAEPLLDDVGITVNKNAIPFDANPPNIGVRDPDRDARPPRPAAWARTRCGPIGDLDRGGASASARTRPSTRASASDVRAARRPLPGPGPAARPGLGPEPRRCG